VRRLICRAHGGFINVKVAAEFLHDARHGGHRQLHNEIQIVRGFLKNLDLRGFRFNQRKTEKL